MARANRCASAPRLLLALAAVALAAGKVIEHKPRQIHFAFGDSDDEMVFTWVTLKGADTSCVQYRATSLHAGGEGVDDVESGSSLDSGFKETCGDNRHYAGRHIHTVRLTDLKPGTRYVYRVGTHRMGWSEIFWFTAKRDAASIADKPLRIIAAGDMGTKEALTLPDISTEVFLHPPDMFIATGDFAYDMDDGEGENADDFLSMIQPVTAYVPYMVTAGNHEVAMNFSEYRNHFHMPNYRSTENLYYSFNVGPVHVVSYFSEVFFWPDYFTHADMTRFHTWLEDDLRTANENRDKQPWIIAFGHRPMYCAVSHELGICDPEYEAIRSGVPSICTKQRGKHCYHLETTRRWNVETLFFTYGVDLVLNGHKHDYERYLPVYEHKVFMSGVENNTYHNPAATVHITTGAAGNKQMKVGGTKEVLRGSCTADAPWCHTQSGWYPQEKEDRGPFDFSYTRLTVFNATHVYLEQFSSLFNSVIDTLWIEQHKHGSFPERRDAAAQLPLSAEAAQQVPRKMVGRARLKEISKALRNEPPRHDEA